MLSRVHLVDRKASTNAVQSLRSIFEEEKGVGGGEGEELKSETIVLRDFLG